GGAAGLPLGLRRDPVPAHQPGDRVHAAHPAPRHQLGVDARAAVAGLHLVVDGSDLGDQRLAPRPPGARRTPPPAVVAAGRDAQAPAHQPDRPGLAVGLDELGSHDDSLAKKAVAFLKIARSIRSRWFSARSRRSSSSRAGRLPWPGKARSPSATWACFQPRRRLSLRSRSRATSATLRPCSVMSLTAATLTPGVNVRLCLATADLLTTSLRFYRSARHSWGSPFARLIEAVAASWFTREMGRPPASSAEALRRHLP